MVNLIAVFVGVIFVLVAAFLLGLIPAAIVYLLIPLVGLHLSFWQVWAALMVIWIVGRMVFGKGVK